MGKSIYENLMDEISIEMSKGRLEANTGFKISDEEMAGFYKMLGKTPMMSKEMRNAIADHAKKNTKKG